MKHPAFVRHPAFTAAVAAATLVSVPAAAQQPKPKCVIICQPSVAFNVAEDKSHILGGPTVRDDTTGKVTKIPSSTNLELQFFISAKTQIPRLSAYVSAQWLPTAKSRANPFTEYTASQVGEDKISANQIAMSIGGMLAVVPAKMAHGWLALDGYVADLMSPAARPADASTYTQKLDMGGVALLYPFAGMDSTSALHKSGLYGYVTFDYVASGLPRAGDDVPKGVRTFLTGAKPAALIWGIGMPIAPLLQAK